MGEDLLEAADKYELIRLKLLCERKLINSLEIANGCAFLALANLHSAEHLKTHSINFIKAHLKEVMKSDGWTHADKQLVEQILEATMENSTSPNGQALKWELHIYPRGYDEESKDYIGIYLHLIDSNNEEVKAKFQFSLRKPNGDEFVLKPMDNEWFDFNWGNKNWGKKKLTKREDLLNENKGYLNGDQLTIECTIVQQKSVQKAPLPDVEVPECRIPEDLSHLFEQSLFCDCKIKTEDEKEFKVHKCILGCRSPVFAAMFEHEMIEKNNNEVNIEDMKGDVIEKMLRFIYSGKEPDFGEMAEDLLEAADKYELIRLKLLCERKLINSLENENACALLALANLHSAEHLKTHSIDFIKMNLKEVMRSDGWTHADHQLKDQILEATMEK